MSKRWKKTLASVVLGTALLMQGGIQLPAASAASAEEAVSNHLTEAIQAAVKSVSVESTPDGSRIAVTVRLYNGASAKQRIPDYELRVQTQDGVEYTLDASSDNKKALKPMEIGELVYMSTVDSKASMKLAGLSFVKVDPYAYPKAETVLLSLPLGSEVWYPSTGSALPGKELAWGTAFSIPGINSDLTYTPVGYERQNTEKGPVAVVTLLAENPAGGRETIPDFRIDARAEKTYTGVRTEKDAVGLEPGEKQYIHFAIPLESNVNPARLLVMTTDLFLPASSQASGSQASGTSGKAGVAIDIGRVAVSLPYGNQAGSAVSSAYAMGTPIAVDPLSKILDHTQVSLMELHMTQNPGEGYKTAVGKFILTSTSDKPIPIPAFDAELVGSGGAAYSGVRQTEVSASMNPGLSYVVSYAFNVPQTEAGEGLVLRLLDSQTAAPYKVAVASVQTALQKETDSDTMQLYPFDIRLVNSTVGTNYLATNSSYSYKMKLELEIKQAENVVVDSNFSKLHFEVVDKLGRVLGTADGSFTGAQRLVSGIQNIVTNNIQSEQFEFPISVNVYELFETPGGQAKRFLKTLN
ncbi:hypothetical protein [Paenibacillus sp. OAS669]|uniref:hypothetical protein n=1 Tax=Paenibacillus sp. OAS669 TaxID=2663821 RepID=UPI00178A5676|nr:hypothetical protein [Paenibacillus sp. OAS669]MBE1442293.1 hypothetical protein [Paenibacillus sp. OAS669]